MIRLLRAIIYTSVLTPIPFMILILLTDLANIANIWASDIVWVGWLIGVVFTFVCLLVFALPAYFIFEKYNRREWWVYVCTGAILGRIIFSLSNWHWIVVLTHFINGGLSALIFWYFAIKPLEKK